MNKFYIMLGDPSEDGHGKSDKILLESNKTIKEMQIAYKASCKLTGISFNHNDDFTGIDRSFMIKKLYQVCAEYEQNALSEEIIGKLVEFKCPSDLLDEVNDDEVEEEGFVKLLMWFIGLSLEGLEWKMVEVKDDIPVLNSSGLDVQFGYGLYL